MANDIMSICINGKKFPIHSDLINQVTDLQYQLSNVEFDNHYTTLNETIKKIEESIKSLQDKICSLEVQVMEEITKLRPQTSEKSENPKQKFDLEIFEEIEASNPFLLNLK